MKLHLTSLGCAKNLVDSEMMLSRLLNAEWDITPDPAEAEVIVVNTCSFIKPAIDESIDTILELAKFKKTGPCRRLIVTGCLPERFGEEIAGALPEVDFFLGTGAYDKIVEAVNETADLFPAAPSRCLLPDPNLLLFHEKDILPGAKASPHIAYIKVAEGCSRHCTYCIIPKLRGRHRSRSAESITAEAKGLVSHGMKELNLVAQDTTFYGADLTPRVGFDQLLKMLSELSQEVWIRFLYGHPESIEEATIEAAARYRNVCAYFDLPIQHASDRILKRMGRRYTAHDLYKLFEKIRHYSPGACLRTTVITGFPGETDGDFKKLITFVKDIRFNHLGVFPYSDSEDLPSHHLSGHVPETIAQERCDALMACQADISFSINRSYIGKTLKALVESGGEDSIYSGRTAFQAPEVDGVTHILASKMLKTGEFIRVKITDASDYDLTGEAV